MIQVGQINTVKESSSSKAKKTSGSGNFSSYLRDVMQVESEGILGTSSMTAADAIFAAQSVGEEEERALRKKQIERGKSLIEQLEEIRDGLLRGYISKERLMNISQFVREHKLEAQDSRLNDIIDEIELRVEVELAKLTK
ncbi:MAG: flagellar assembly protein FliX [Alphaproteobacteria bacterium]|nr:flagellar assembly protein FliX [Alphaproteobacteria bacterium]